MPNPGYEDIPGSSPRKKLAAAKAARAAGRQAGKKTAKQKLSEAKFRGKPTAAQKTAAATARRNAQKAAVEARAKKRIRAAETPEDRTARARADYAKATRRPDPADRRLSSWTDQGKTMDRKAEQARLILEKEKKRST
jgi:hypothetical protein